VQCLNRNMSRPSGVLFTIVETTLVFLSSIYRLVGENGYPRGTLFAHGQLGWAQLYSYTRDGDYARGCQRRIRCEVMHTTGDVIVHRTHHATCSIYGVSEAESVLFVDGQVVFLVLPHSSCEGMHGRGGVVFHSRWHVGYLVMWNIDEDSRTRTRAYGNAFCDLFIILLDRNLSISLIGGSSS